MVHFLWKLHPFFRKASTDFVEARGISHFTELYVCYNIVLLKLRMCLEVGALAKKKSYEYDNCVKLDNVAGTCFSIPASIILDNAAGDKLITSFSFFSVTRGIDCKSAFTMNWMVEWSGRNPDRHSGGINKKFSIAVNHLRDSGYVSFDGEVSNSKMSVATFDKDKLTSECNESRFALVYLDELNKILEWENPNARDPYTNNDVLLRVFAYLRMVINRRRNALFPEEMNVDDKNDHSYDIERRRLRSPDAYNAYYSDMAEELGISPRAIAKAVDALCEIGLIYAEPLPRVKINGKWKTKHTIFCNTYKREGGYLLASGKGYYMREVANKKKLLGIIAKNDF